MKLPGRIPFTLTLLLLGVSSALSDDFDGASFSLRLPATLTRFSPFGDVAGDAGASSASKWASSVNPAALAWSFAQDYKIGEGVQFSNVRFDSGTQLNFISEATTFDAKDLGVFQISFGGISSNERPVLDSPLLPLKFEYDLWGGRVNWGKRMGDLSVGAAFGLVHSDTDFHAPTFDAVHASENLWLFRLGAQKEFAPHWLAGLVGDYSYGPTTTTTLAPRPGITEDATHQFTLRPGLAYEFLPNALVHVDYVAGWFHNDSGRLDFQRVMTGVDIPLATGFFLRSGALVDWRGNFSWTAGLGFHPSKNYGLELAYQNDMFPEIGSEFGHSRTLNASIHVQF